jgi:hypothetical protein
MKPANRFRFNALLTLSCLVLLAASVSSFSAEIALRTDLFGEKPEVTLLRRDADGMQFEVRVPLLERLDGVLDGRRWDRLEIPGGGFSSETGAPEVPNFSRLIALPPTAGIHAEFQVVESTTISGLDLMPAQGADPADLQVNPQPVRFDIASYSRDSFYPERRVVVSEPAISRGVRLVSLTMNPVQYNPVTREVRIAHRFRVTVHFDGTDERNVPDRRIWLSSSWAKSLSGLLVNTDDLDVDADAMGSYLIVCENDANLQNLLNQLVDWKKRKGHSVTVQTFSPGASNTTIKNLIQTAYNTWPTPPEFVLLFGDVDGDYALPGWTVGSWPSDQIDHPYSQLDGSDVLADVAVGRLPADNSTEAQTLINKVLFYEKMPYITDSNWYHQGVLIAGNSGSGISTIQVNRYIKTRMVLNEFTRIDTFWYNMSGSVAGTLSPAINNGVSIANYRGDYLMENFYVSSIDNLTNGRKLPFVVTITCGTGGFAGSSESLMEHFVAVGTPTVPKGAIACVGTATLLTHTRQNNTLSYGTFAGLFDEGLTQAGNAMNRGKLELFNAFQTYDPTSVSEFSKYAALAGDPGVEIFNRAIQFMTCTIPGTVQWGVNSLSFTVNETGVGPLEGATVCLYKPDADLHVVGLTDANGQVTLPLNISSTGNVKVTITKHNFYPIVDSLNVEQAGVAVGYYSHTVDDDNLGGSSGDGDHIINPGEVVQIPLTFKNYGNTTTATGVSVTATENDPYVTLSNPTQSFPNLAPGATGGSSGSLLLQVSADCPHGHIIHLDFVTNSGQGNWNGGLDLEVVSYSIATLSAYASGADTLLSPGETANFVLTVRNQGGKNAVSLTASLTSLDSYVTVNDNNAGFGTVNAGSAGSCAADPFNLTAAADTPPGHYAKLKVIYSSAANATQTDTITITLGNRSTADPQGPDQYGYYCFDNTDLNYAQCPTYSWVEINPTQGGQGTQLAINDPSENQDMSIALNLPFTFQYYGVDYNAITVCSNGWISMGANNSFADFRNYPIPSCVGPYAMIAPFWDDLKTTTTGKVYAWSDATNHRLIVEWYQMPTLGSPNPLEKFQVILYDPAYYPTPTGDGEILFQYSNIQQVYGYSDDIPYSTVGIESPDQQDGIEISYWNSYNNGAAPLQNGRAYFFTTNFAYNPPGTNLHVTLTPSGTPIVIPASGGSFNFNIAVGNSGASPASADIWCMITLPSGSTYGPVIGPLLGINMPAGWSADRNRTQAVPGSAPPGAYQYRAYVGVYPSTIYDEDSFPFTKSSTGLQNAWVEEWSNYGEPFESEINTGTEVPTAFALHTAYPNPFNPQTSVSFDLPVTARVKMEIYDLSGRRVAVLINRTLSAGIHQVDWNASAAASGIYLLRMEADQFQAVQKLVLMK